MPAAFFRMVVVTFLGAAVRCKSELSELPPHPKWVLVKLYFPSPRSTFSLFTVLPSLIQAAELLQVDLLDKVL